MPHTLPTPPGPYKEWEADEVGTYAQKNYDFTDRLFNTVRGQGLPGLKGAALRKRFWDCTKNDQLQSAIFDELGIDLPRDVLVAVCDVEVGDLKVINKIDPAANAYYLLVLPPNPRRYPLDDNYLEDQALEDAWYHATVDGYGM